VADAREAGAHIEQFLGELSPEVLRDVQLGETWAQVLSGVPSPAWAAFGQARLPGLAALIGVREHWRRVEAWRPAAATTRGLVQLLSERLGADHPDTLAELAALGQLAAAAGHGERARALLDQAWRGLREAPIVRRLAVAQPYLRLLLEQQALSVAFEVANTCWLATRDTPAALRTAQWMAEVHGRRDQEAAALEVLLQAWRSAQATAGPDQLRCAEWIVRLARRLDRAGEALPAARLLVAAAGEPERRAEAQVRLVELLEAVGAEEEALRTAEEVLRWTRAAGSPHPSFAARATLVARLRWGRGQLDEAESLLQEALEVERRLHGEGSPQVARRYLALGRMAARTGRVEEAVGWLEPAWQLLRTEGDAVEARSVGEDLLATLETWGRRSGDDADLQNHCAQRVLDVAAMSGLGAHAAVGWARRQLGS
jgi:tetratricopeptide (TPR) repeat protein